MTHPIESEKVALEKFLKFVVDVDIVQSVDVRHIATTRLDGFTDFTETRLAFEKLAVYRSQQADQCEEQPHLHKISVRIRCSGH